jgi:putative PIN family toxin of toxin-antitoxin system
MKILFDTNVLISTFLAFKEGSNCYDVIDHAVEYHQLYYTPFVMQEFKRVFKEDFHYPESVIDKFAAFITIFFTKADTADTVESVCRDPKDNQILADALRNSIEVIVTGDNDLLVLETHRGIKIISPKDYWKL